jgi:hypothetical protein
MNHSLQKGSSLVFKYELVRRIHLYHSKYSLLLDNFSVTHKRHTILVIGDHDVFFYKCAKIHVTFLIMTFSNFVNEIRIFFARSGLSMMNMMIFTFQWLTFLFDLDIHNFHLFIVCMSFSWFDMQEFLGVRGLLKRRQTNNKTLMLQGYNESF